MYRRLATRLSGLSRYMIYIYTYKNELGLVTDSEGSAIPCSLYTTFVS